MHASYSQGLEAANPPVKFKPTVTAEQIEAAVTLSESERAEEVRKK